MKPMFTDIEICATTSRLYSMASKIHTWALLCIVICIMQILMDIYTIEACTKQIHRPRYTFL